ncbi:hypothetical protein LUZ60_000112 [Juncus effusus]|nr:hypothetical protein LUZ60_000112 [Juncus effusus]
MADSKSTISSPNPAGEAPISSPPDAAAVAAEAAAAAEVCDPESGFQREEFGKASLVGTVAYFERHVFLCYKGPDVWPSHVESSESDRLPRLLAGAISSKKGAMKKKTRLTICEGEDGTDSSNGDVLIFPDMIRYRRLTHFDVDNFVEEVLVKESEWLPGSAEAITGAYVYVCAHGSRDKRCGVCGPALIDKFKEEVGLRGLEGQVSVSACSHIGGHKYAGNVIIFAKGENGEVTGHWYGYVAPDDVALLLDQHIIKGEVIDHLWRGQLGLSEEDQKKALELRQQTKTLKTNSSSCCQGGNSVNSSCCQNGSSKEASERNITEETNDDIAPEKGKEKAGKSKSFNKKICHMPGWIETWEREDSYAALAVVVAGAAVYVAYSLYKHHHQK